MPASYTAIYPDDSHLNMIQRYLARSCLPQAIFVALRSRGTWCSGRAPSATFNVESGRSKVSTSIRIFARCARYRKGSAETIHTTYLSASVEALRAFMRSQLPVEEKGLLCPSWQICICLSHGMGMPNWPLIWGVVRDNLAYHFM